VFFLAPYYKTHFFREKNLKLQRSEIFDGIVIFITHKLKYCIDEWFRHIGVRTRLPTRKKFLCLLNSVHVGLGLTHPPMNLIPGVLSLKIRLPLREMDHSFPSGVEIKNAWSYFSTTHMPSLRAAQ